MRERLGAAGRPIVRCGAAARSGGVAARRPPPIAYKLKDMGRGRANTIIEARKELRNGHRAMKRSLGIEIAPAEE